MPLVILSDQKERRIFLQGSNMKKKFGRNDPYSTPRLAMDNWWSYARSD